MINAETLSFIPKNIIYTNVTACNYLKVSIIQHLKQAQTGQIASLTCTSVWTKTKIKWRQKFI